jgi:type I restriction enzyme M protein
VPTLTELDPIVGLPIETAGEHFTPREVIRLMVDLLFIEDDDVLQTPGTVRTMLDPACGTGGAIDG